MSNSFIDLGNVGDLAKPVTSLIEKISNAIGASLAPWQIKRLAKANTEADLIKSEGEIKIRELQKRSVNRFIAEETKKQINMESIIKKASSQINESAKPEKVNDDWIINFFDKCKVISDQDMQALWARVLSGETNRPGSFSRRTVNFIGSLDKHEASLFVNFCSFCCFNGAAIPFIYDFNCEIYKRHKIQFSTLKVLNDIGLISLDSFSGYRLQNLQQKIAINYFGKQILINFDKPCNNELFLGKALLTKIGEEIAPICGAKPIDNFIEYLLSKLQTQNLKVRILDKNFTSGKN